MYSSFIAKVCFASVGVALGLTSIDQVAIAQMASNWPTSDWSASDQVTSNQVAPASHSSCQQCGSHVCTSSSKCKKCIYGYDCAKGCEIPHRPWRAAYPIDFDTYAQGEYAGPPRSAHQFEYRVRVRDVLQFTYVVSRDISKETYRIGVGDELMIESLADETLNRGTLERGLQVQTDGTLHVRLLGNVHAAGLTFEQLKRVLDEKYKAFYNKPGIDVSPVRTNVPTTDIRNAIGGSGGFNEQAINRTVTPAGQITLPRLGDVWVQGLTVAEVKHEINLRYGTLVSGLEVEVALDQQAPHFITVLGEVNQPGRFEVVSPTTTLSAIALAQGHRVGANLRQVVVFRRSDDWRLISTMVDVRQAVVVGKDPLPSGEIWLRDGDVIVIPSSPIRRFDNFVSLVFTQGIYGIVPFQGFDLVEAVNGFEFDNGNGF